MRADRHTPLSVGGVPGFPWGEGSGACLPCIPTSLVQDRLPFILSIFAIMSILQMRGRDHGEVTEENQMGTQTGEKPKLTTIHTRVSRREQQRAEPVVWLGFWFVKA